MTLSRSVRTALVLCLVLSVHEASAADRTFAGVTRLTSDTNWQYDVITFDDQSVIVTNGHQLRLEGRSEIILKGTPRIISFEPRALQPGEAGRSGGTIYIKTRALTGTALKIENVGESGANGSAGPAGGKGAKGPQGGQRHSDVLKGCIGGSDGGQGGPGGDGGDGGAGGTGGAGGAVVLDIGQGCWNGGVPRFDIDVSGGAGGLGGAAGPAGVGGDGGDGAPGTFWCGGTSPGPSGPAGKAGRAGVHGAAGNPGPIIDVQLTCTPKEIKPERGAVRN